MSRTFAYVDVVSQSKNRAVMQEPEFPRDYQPWLINRAFSYHPDSILAANQMNLRASLDVRLQFLYLLNTLAPRKRFAKWHKPTTADDVLLVAEYYECSVRHARNILPLHSPDQLKKIAATLDKGGKVTKRVKHDSS